MNRNFRALICLVLFNPLLNGGEPTGDLTVRRDIAYAAIDGFSQHLTSLDVYTVAKSANRPVLVWIHGGGWRTGDKGHVQTKPAVFVKEGFVFASINYRLVPNVTYREQAQDVAAAISFLQTHAHEYGGNPERIVVMGHSAGAHLAALVATDDRYLQEAGLALSAIKGVVLLDGGGYDIARQMNELAGPRNRQTYSSVFGEDERVWKDASPITHVDMGKGIAPFLILHVAGRRYSAIQSTGLAAALNQAGISAEVFPAKNKTHATINRELGQPGDPPTQTILQFLDRIASQ